MHSQFLTNTSPRNTSPNTHTHHHHTLDHIHARNTFALSRFCYTLPHHEQLHHSVVIHYTNAINAFAISHNYPNTKYVTQNMPLSPYTHTLILVKLLTSPGSATRYTTHDIPLHHRVLMYCTVVTPPTRSQYTTTISSQHLPPKHTSITIITLTPPTTQHFRPPDSATRYTTHDIPLHHRVLMYCTVVTPQPYHRNICRPTHTSIIPHTHTPNHSTLSTS